MPGTDERLLNAPLFSGLDADGRNSLLSAGMNRKLREGANLFMAGDRAEAFYILISGRMKLVRHTPQGKEMLLHLVHPGESFAEAALLGEGTYPATAVALEHSEVWCCPRSRLLELIRRSPDMALGMILSISAWTRQLAAKLEMQTQRRVEERLAIYLLGRSGGRKLESGDELLFDEPKNLIAAQIGTVPEVLSRTLRRLQKDGILESTHDRVRIVDPQRFHLLAEPL